MKKLFIALCFVGTAQAATQGVDINGTVSSSCAFSSFTNGTFGYNVQTATTLDTAAQGGTNASVNIIYNGLPTVSAAEVTAFTAVPSGFTDTVVFTNVLTSNNGGSISYSSGVASYTQTGGTSDTLTLRLIANDNTGPFPLGSYSANAVFTCI